MRVMIAVTHLLGAGHLVRAAAIARALTRAGHETTLISGGAPTPGVSTEGASLVQLPAVRAGVASFTTLLDEAGQPVGPAHLARRRELLLAAYATCRPEIVVTELFPFGRRVLAAEFRALVGAIEGSTPRPLLVSSVRDILVRPEKTAKLDAAHALLRRAYDAVLVHGDADIVPFSASWPLPADLLGRLRYTGYVDGSTEPQTRTVAGGTSVLVSGGSSAASLPLYRAALAAARLSPGRRWRVLVGHGVASDDFEKLRRDAPPPARVERARPDFRDCLAEAAVFVGQAGYNTVMDILATRVPAVLVPFERGHETEQRLRAEELARRGYADLLPEAELDAARLARRVEAAAVRPWPAGGDIRRDGATRTASLLAELLDRRRAGAAGAARR